jgi:hypothetical protein
MLEVLRPYGVLEMVRTGRVAMGRGSHVADWPTPDISRWEDERAGVAEL